MKDCSILSHCHNVTLRDSLSQSIRREGYNRGDYKFKNPKNTIYAEILKYIDNEGMVTRPEIFKKFLLPRIEQKGHKICSPSTYYGNFWQSAQRAGIIKKYKYGNKYYYTITDEGRTLI